MKRRDFLKFLRNGAGVAVIAATVGVPEVETQEPNGGYFIPSYGHEDHEAFIERLGTLIKEEKRQALDTHINCRCADVYIGGGFGDDYYAGWIFASEAEAKELDAEIMASGDFRTILDGLNGDAVPQWNNDAWVELRDFMEIKG